MSFIDIFNKKEQDILDFPEINEPRISDVVAEKDNFFHTAWMMLKSRRHDLWEEMTVVELMISGYDTSEEKKEDIDDIPKSKIL